MPTNSSTRSVVFSCSLLHQALPVTKGRRFCFLPFLYDQDGARIYAASQGGAQPGI